MSSTGVDNSTLEPLELGVSTPCTVAQPDPQRRPERPAHGDHPAAERGPPAVGADLEAAARALIKHTSGPLQRQGHRRRDRGTGARLRAARDGVSLSAARRRRLPGVRFEVPPGLRRRPCRAWTSPCSSASPRRAAARAGGGRGRRPVPRGLRTGRPRWPATPAAARPSTPTWARRSRPSSATAGGAAGSCGWPTVIRPCAAASRSPGWSASTRHRAMAAGVGARPGGGELGRPAHRRPGAEHGPAAGRHGSLDDRGRRLLLAATAPLVAGDLLRLTFDGGRTLALVTVASTRRVGTGWRSAGTGGGRPAGRPRRHGPAGAGARRPGHRLRRGRAGRAAGLDTTGVPGRLTLTFAGDDVPGPGDLLRLDLEDGSVMAAPVAGPSAPAGSPAPASVPSDAPRSLATGASWLVRRRSPATCPPGRPAAGGRAARPVGHGLERRAAGLAPGRARVRSRPPPVLGGPPDRRAALRARGRRRPAAAVGAGGRSAPGPGRAGDRRGGQGRGGMAAAGAGRHGHGVVGPRPLHRHRRRHPPGPGRPGGLRGRAVPRPRPARPGCRHPGRAGLRQVVHPGAGPAAAGRPCPPAGRRDHPGRGARRRRMPAGATSSSSTRRARAAVPVAAGRRPRPGDPVVDAGRGRRRVRGRAGRPAGPGPTHRPARRARAAGAGGSAGGRPWGRHRRRHAAGGRRLPGPAVAAGAGPLRRRRRRPLVEHGHGRAAPGRLRALHPPAAGAGGDAGSRPARPRRGRLAGLGGAAGP